MKKILLVIAIVLCIFQMVVLAVEIDIGSAATDRASALAAYTLVDKNNPANVSGIITSVEIWADTTLTDCEVATFYVVSGNYLSTRDYEYIGSVTAGAKRTFSINLDVEAGDYIGIYYSGGALYGDNLGDGRWYSSADRIPCENTLFSSLVGKAQSLYGTGVLIDIGNPAIDRPTAMPVNYTIVDKVNPANDTGKITSVEMWFLSDATNVEVATFYVVSGDNLTVRDSVAIGNVTSGSKQTFPVDLDVVAGDYIGYFCLTGSLGRTNVNTGYWALSGDNIPCTDTTFGFTATREMSLHGTGTTVIGWDGPFSGVTITKWNSIEITKWNTIE